MGLEEIVPAIFLIAVLVLVLPEFLDQTQNQKHYLRIYLFGL